MTTKYVQMRNPKLQSAIGTSDTSAVFTEFVDLAGNPLTQSDFGTTGYGTLEPNTAREEAISFTIDSNPSGTATLTITRALQGKHPYGTGGTAFSHEAQAELVISNNPDLFNKLTAKDNDETITGSWKYPVTPTHNQNPATKKHVEDTTVQNTGNETIDGEKTFSTAPKIPDSAAADEALTKGQFDSDGVKLTGDQTIAGTKTFSTAPKVPDATAADEPYTKGQHDADAAASSAVASPTVRGSAKLDTAADDPLDPEVLTATSDRTAALAGGGDFGTPDGTNQFLTEDWYAANAVDVQTFSSSGTWTKPSQGSVAFVELWGAGGSGAAIKSSSGADRCGASAGGGGVYRKVIIPLSELDASHSVTIGSGGSAVSESVDGNTENGNSGGTTSFGSITASGGAGGVASIFSGGPVNASGGSGGSETELTKEDGGNGGDASADPGATADDGGSTIFSGPGGGAAAHWSSDNDTGAGGVASFSPSTGGAGAFTDGTGGANAGDGTFGGGGGAATVQNATGTATSGAGGDGYCRVTIL